MVTGKLVVSRGFREGGLCDKLISLVQEIVVNVVPQQEIQQSSLMITNIDHAFTEE